MCAGLSPGNFAGSPGLIMDETRFLRKMGDIVGGFIWEMSDKIYLILIFLGMR